MSNNDVQALTIEELFFGNAIYTIPSYQRNYAWGQAQVEQLVTRSIPWPILVKRWQIASPNTSSSSTAKILIKHTRKVAIKKYNFKLCKTLNNYCNVYNTQMPSFIAR